MPKKKPRKRQKRNVRAGTRRTKHVQQPAPRRNLVPSAQQPLLEVHLDEGAPATVQEMCLRYWAFTVPGTWTYKVSDLGPAGHVPRTVKSHSRASVVHLLCPQCSGPLVVRTRSDLSGIGIWHEDKFPSTERESRYPCGECREAADQAYRRSEEAAAAQRRQARARARQEEQAVEAARVASANRWLAQHADRPRPGELPQPRDAVSLLTMISIMVRTDTHAFGPLSKLGYLLGPSPSADAATVKDLHQLGWIAPTTPATTGDFAFREDHTAEAVFVDRVRHRPRTR